MAFVHYLKKPELRNPVVIAAFAGWNDAADAATTAVKFLIDRWKPLKFAEIEAEEFYVFTETRPTISAKKGVLRAISWPSNHFLSLITPQFERDIILYLGVEPQLKWKTFSSSYLDVCKRFNVSEVLLLGEKRAKQQDFRDVEAFADIKVAGRKSLPFKLRLNTQVKDDITFKLWGN